MERRVTIEMIIRRNIRTTICEMLIFLIFAGFFGLENYLIVLLFITIVFFTKKIIVINKVVSLAFILFLHSCIYLFNYGIPTLDWVSKNLMSPVVLFYGGYLITVQSGNYNKSLYILAIAFLIHGGLNTIYYALNTNSMINRSMVNIWGGEITATLQNIFFIPITAIFYYVLMVNKSKLQRWIVGIGALIALYSTFVTASRTLLLISIINIAICAILAKIVSNKSIVKLFTVFIIFIGIAIIAIELNIGDVQTWLYNTALLERFGTGTMSDGDTLINNARWAMSYKVLNEFKNKPFGNITVVNYAHNLFLDIGKFTGIFPSLFLLIWSIIQLGSFLKKSIFDSKNIDRLAIFSGMLGLFIVFFLEPILLGLPIAFSAFCYLSGVACACKTIDITKRRNQIGK